MKLRPRIEYRDGIWIVKLGGQACFRTYSLATARELLDRLENEGPRR